MPQLTSTSISIEKLRISVSYCPEVHLCPPCAISSHPYSHARPLQKSPNGSLYRPIHPALGFSHFERLPPFNSLSKSDAATESSDSGRPTDGSAAAEAKIRESLSALKAVSTKVGQDFFSALPSDLRVDASDAAFDLSRGNMPGECGQAAADALTALSQIFLGLSKDVPPLPTATSALVTSIETLPPQSSERLAVARRIKSAGRRLVGMGAYNGGKAVQLGQAMVAAGDAVAAAGGREAESQVGASQPVRTLRFGSLAVELTPGSTRAGAAVAVAFG